MESCSALGCPLSPLLLGRIGIRDIVPGEPSAPSIFGSRHGCTLSFLWNSVEGFAVSIVEALFIGRGG